MAEALISTIVEQLGSMPIRQLEKEVTLVVGVKNDVRKLKSNMESIQAVIQDAKERYGIKYTARVCVDKLKDVSYDIDDVLDEWSTAILKVEIDRAENPSSKVCFFIPTSCCMFRQIIIRRDIAVKIKDLNERLDVIAKEMIYGAFQPSSQTITPRIRETIRETIECFVDGRDIVGRVDDKKSLIHMLLSERSHTSNVSIISIIGMGGLGKTTLAQFAYNDNTIHAHFQKRMWVRGSYPLNATRVAKAIIEALTGSAPNLNTLNPLLKEIREHIKGKRFLLVLDDVWCENYDWCRKLLASLKAGCLPGSKILITTRKVGVANAVGSTIFQLRVLGDKDSLDLFKLVTFCDWTAEERQHVEDIGNEIVKECKGLPLALKDVGGYLRMKKSEQQWRDVLGKGDLWRWQEEGVFPVLLLSYNDLSPALRQCFLYFVVFPKDYEIRKDDIINLWMAQGYLVAEKNREMEKVGDEYFSELAMRSFFLDFEKDNSGKITWCKMHDIVHDFARSITENEFLTIEVNDFKKPYSKASSYANMRHLILRLETHKFSFPISLGSLKSLRTLKLTCDDYSGLTYFEREDLKTSDFDESFDQVLGQLTSLRTLDLSNTPIEKLPKKVGKLLHLRYLNLEGCRELKELPDDIWALCNLLILNIKGCDRLTRLPSGLGKAINLRKLLVWDKEGLTCIRHLNEFVVVGSDSNWNEASTLSNLTELNQLRGSFTVRGLGNVREASEAKKAKLIKLALDCYSGFHRGEDEAEVRRSREREVINALHPSLSTLVLYNTPCPDWMTPSLMTNLKQLHFGSSCEVLPALGNFPFLEYLKICSLDRLKRVGFEFLGTSESFPRLKKLIFTAMDEWEDWDYNYTTVVSTEEGSCNISPTTTSIISTMPCLQELVISDCPKLKGVPDDILNKVPSLQILYITGCPILKEYMIQCFPGDTRPSCLIMLD